MRKIELDNCKLFVWRIFNLASFGLYVYNDKYIEYYLRNIKGIELIGNSFKSKFLAKVILKIADK